MEVGVQISWRWDVTSQNVEGFFLWRLEEWRRCHPAWSQNCSRVPEHPRTLAVVSDPSCWNAQPHESASKAVTSPSKEKHASLCIWAPALLHLDQSWKSPLVLWKEISSFHSLLLPWQTDSSHALCGSIVERNLFLWVDFPQGKEVVTPEKPL